ncbi:Fic/DOC family N-terminal domain-containing protein [Halorussus caseinilyticus]|uniref:Fic/DOC family N-terminal domain-containing protein n=1 Tax=Halorussus caseinilyticus TaxID=3034025 RepID=A0ABD5WP28_9EURY|nr:Fic/DOC family N-terminal domain-containing protein [Halorussus sp. DT72]
MKADDDRYMNIEQFQSATTPGELVNSDGRMAFKPAPLPPTIEIEGELLDVFTEATTNVGQLSGIGSRVENPSMLISPFIYKEAVISSEIEGTRVTLSDVYEYEAGQDDPDGPNRNRVFRAKEVFKVIEKPVDELKYSL